MEQGARLVKAGTCAARADALTRRILQIIPTLDLAGAEKQMVMLAAGLSRKGFDVHVCALTRGGPRRSELEQAGVPNRVIGKRGKLDPVAFWRLAGHIRRLRPELVHTWLFAANCYGRAAARAAGIERIVAGERCVDPWKSSHEWAIDRRLARWTQRIVVNSPGVRDFCLEHGLPAEKFVVIPGGVEPAPPAAVERGVLLEEFGLEPGALLIGAIGRLWPQKRVKDLIWAADLVHLLCDRARLLILGDGPQRAMLERFTRLLRAEGYVRFLGERNDVQRIMPHLDLVWLGSEYEGLPNSVMEAMAAARPVVATDIPGCRDLIRSGESGFLVPVGGRAERARATLKIIENQDLARRIGQAARQRVLAEFSSESMIERHARLYSELL